MTDTKGWKIQTLPSIADVKADAWDNLVGKVDTFTDPANPFVSHAFLLALEQSGAVGRRSGWMPAHQAVFDGQGVLIAAAPCYVKSHSQGEYVFDHAWADALERAGGQYYPKLQIAVPFTPAPGPRLIGADTIAKVAALQQGFEGLRQRIDGSSIHVTFLPESEARALEALGYLLRTNRQFHWQNENYEDFEGFLAALASRKRKMIRRERKDALSPGITIEWVTGKDLTERHWDAFFHFYMDTGSRKWGRPYLNRDFFSHIGASMSERIVLVLARRAGQYIAGAINFLGAQTLYGRNWGAIEEHPFLHFEVCYYQAIDFAIAHGLKTVEAGAQGEHKLARGYQPRTTYSAHSIAHSRLRDAVASYLLREQEHMSEEKIVLDSMAPFRRT